MVGSAGKTETWQLGVLENSGLRLCCCRSLVLHMCAVESKSSSASAPKTAPRHKIEGILSCISASHQGHLGHGTIWTQNFLRPRESRTALSSACARVVAERQQASFLQPSSSCKKQLLGYKGNVGHKMDDFHQRTARRVGEQRTLQYRPMFANNSLLSSDAHITSFALTLGTRERHTPSSIWHDATRFCRDICPTCQKYVEGDWYRSFDLGRPAEIRSRSQCSFCQKIAQLLQPFAQYLDDEQVRCQHFQLGEILITQGGIHLGRLVLQIGQQNQQTRTPETGSHYEKLREWISECVNSHKHPLRDCFKRYQTPIDFTLIDVVDNCLVKASTRVKYLALSYVWGSSNTLMTTTSNRHQLEQPGSLLRHADKIGTLLRNAMELVRNLGERYLWVDSLCIEQDNSSQKLGQINLMDIIYGQALTTIVAIASESASSQFPDIGTANQPIPIAPGLALDTMAPVFGAVLERSLYETRGWTLQERVLSQRCLFMTNHGVTFNCPSGWRDRNGTFKLLEEFNTVTFLHSPPKSFSGLSWTSYFTEYADLVYQYTSRNLSHATDAINAFSGILHLFQTALGGEMISGLPETYLDIALLWSPSGSVTRNENFPSWSWAGWTGPSSYSGPPMLQSYLKLISSEVEEFQWAQIGRRRTARRKLDQAAADFRAGEDHHSQLIETPRLIDVLYFRTATIAARSFCLRTYRHAGGKEAQGTVPSAASETLKSKMAHGKPAFLNLDGSGSPYTVIVDALDRQCGVVLAANNSIDSFIANWDERPLEYVLLSKVPCPSMTVMSHTDIHSWYWYYVLLVEWRSDYAERVALCAISSRAWALAHPRMKDIALG
jgi:hypothetical protein